MIFLLNRIKAKFIQRLNGIRYYRTAWGSIKLYDIKVWLNYTYHIYYTISYHTIHYHFIFHYTIPYDTISYLMIQYNIIFYNIILYDSMQYHTFFLQCQHKSSARSYDDWRFSFSYSLFGHYLSPYCLWTFPWVSSITTRSTRPMWPVNRGCLLLHGTSSFLLFL